VTFGVTWGESASSDWAREDCHFGFAWPPFGAVLFVFNAECRLSGAGLMRIQ
jgi:hypothetical protein